jgi:glycosyltransferase involved in cell wall biosynthesis
MSTPRASIVLPTRNGAATLPAVLDAISRQRADFSFEVIAVDSSSTDGTADLLRRRCDRLISIAAEAFDHGLTRNLGIEQAAAAPGCQPSRALLPPALDRFVGRRADRCGDGPRRARRARSGRATRALRVR